MTMKSIKNNLTKTIVRIVTLAGISPLVVGGYAQGQASQPKLNLNLPPAPPPVNRTFVQPPSLPAPAAPRIGVAAGGNQFGGGMTVAAPVGKATVQVGVGATFQPRIKPVEASVGISIPHNVGK